MRNFNLGMRAALGFYLGVVLLAACGERESRGFDEGTIDSQGATGESISPPATFTLEQAVEEFPESLLSLAGFRQGLQGLARYQQETLLVFDGLGPGGQPESWQVSVTELVSSEPRASSLTLTTEGFKSSELPDSMKFVRAADVGYLLIGGSGCISGFDIGTDTAMLFRPVGIIGEVSGAKLVASDQPIGEVPSRRYQFSEQELPAFRDVPVSIAGDIYVASEGGYVTHLDLSAEGPLDFLGDGLIREGVYRLEVDVSKIEDGIIIEPPVECTQELPYPLPTGALEITSLDDLLSFKTQLSIEEVVEFYQSKLPATGWSESAEPAVFEDLAILAFQRGDEEVTVQIASEPGDNQISVFISP